jgi:hypothetical protein
MQPGGDELGEREHQADTGVYSQRCKVRPTAWSHACDQPPSFSTLSALGHNYGDVFSGLALLGQAASGNEAASVSSFAKSAVRSWRVNFH